MQSNQSDIWLTNSKIFGEIQRNVPRIKEIDNDRFIQYNLLQNYYEHKNKQIYSKPSNINLIYWANEKFGLEKCIFDSESKSFNIQNIRGFPHKKDYMIDLFKNYGPRISAGTFVASWGIGFGAITNKLNEPAPYILTAGLFTLIFIAMGEMQEYNQKEPMVNLVKQEILADRQAWKSYRKSSFGRRF